MGQTAAELAVEGWFIAQAACQAMGSFDPDEECLFSLAENGRLRALDGGADGRNAVLRWQPSSGWCACLPTDDPRRDLLDLYLPICSANASRPIIVGHLGQSLDGFIATTSGDACFVTGPQNILHLHRLRALCDAVIVGARTVENDNPRLTTRLVSGDNPLRVVLDPKRRLADSHHVFSDGDATTVRVTARVDGGARNGSGSRNGSGADARELIVGCVDGQLDLHDLVRQLRARGCARIFIEGGGVTVSAFLEAGLLDRLHIAVAPLLIGEGRPAIRMAPRRLLKDCMKVHPRIYRTGEDVLFDCDLRAKVAAVSQKKADAVEVARVS
jgi:diaminohydroxyphosphoribosylaminopyrimidine deaminase / 5-amino-6-(5-phosphoribosylamino)uracil reductase